MAERRYSDDQLATAIAASRSWRGVLRHLGLAATSSSAIRSVRHHADGLGLDHGHFTGQRRWTDEQLRAAVSTCRSWAQVAEGLSLSGGSSVTSLKGHAARLGIDTAHLSRDRPVRPGGLDAMRPKGQLLPRAGSMLAAAWFTLSGYDVSWPLEPCRYDLVVRRGDQFLRVQVKTTRVRGGGSWLVRLSTGGRNRVTYDPDEIDSFFIIDGDLHYYLIPVAAVGGLQGIHVSAYLKFRLQTSIDPT